MARNQQNQRFNNRNLQGQNYDFNQDRGPRDDYHMGMYDDDTSDFDFGRMGGRNEGRYNEGRYNEGRSNERSGRGRSMERSNWDTGMSGRFGSDFYDQDRDFSLNERNRRGGQYDLGHESRERSGGENWRQEGRQGMNFFGKGPKGWKRTDDRIKEEVCEALSDSYLVDASEIDVSVKDGHVTLKGTIDSREGKREAERCVENLRGVTDVQNDLRVSKSENVTDMRRGTDTTNQRASGLS